MFVIDILMVGVSIIISLSMPVVDVSMSVVGVSVVGVPMVGVPVAVVGVLIDSLISRVKLFSP